MSPERANPLNKTRTPPPGDWRCPSSTPRPSMGGVAARGSPRHAHLPAIREDASCCTAGRSRNIANRSEAPQVTALNCLTLDDNGQQL